MATQDGGASGAQAPEQPRRRRRKWPWVLGILGALFVVVAGAAGWLAYTGVQAKRGLDTAADALTGAQSSLLGGDVTEAQAAVQQASALTAEARTITSDPVWRVVTLMHEGGYRQIPVVDGQQRVAGCVRHKDIAGYLVSHFADHVLNLPPDPERIAQTPEGA